LSHQRGKTTTTTKKKQSTTKCPKFKCNTVSISFSACRCSSVVVSSKEERKKKRIWGQLCDCLSEAVPHLLAAVSHLLLESLLIADLRNVGSGYSPLSCGVFLPPPVL
jgi:hypothetical protein